MIEQRLVHRLKRLQQALRAAMDRELDGLGVSPSQYATLAALEGHPTASNAELARVCFVTPQTMNELVRSLETSGLAERSPIAGRRVVPLSVTVTGRRLVRAAESRIEAVEARALGVLTAAERRTFLRAVALCAGALEA